MRVVPSQPHFGFDRWCVERPPDCLRHGGAKRRALAFGNAATDHLVAKVFLAVLQHRDLGFERAELVGQIADGEVCEGVI